MCYIGTLMTIDRLIYGILWIIFFSFEYKPVLILNEFAKRYRIFLREETFIEFCKCVTYWKNSYIINKRYNSVISIFLFNFVVYFKL